MTFSHALLLAALITGSCAKKQDAPPAPEETPVMPVAEMKRARDACAAYLAKVCACPQPSAVEECKLAALIPGALDIAREVSISPDSERDTVLQANHLIRQNEKSCIEKSAALAGC